MSDTAIRPKWATYATASKYSGLSVRHLQRLVAEDEIVSSLPRRHGAKRGVRLVDLDSLDDHIRKGIGSKTDLEMNRNREGGGA